MLRISRLIRLILIVLPLQIFAQTEAGDPLIRPRMRVIMDNDFSGDPDGLFALAHLLLSPSVDVRAIIGSQFTTVDTILRSSTMAEDAAAKVSDLMQRMHIRTVIPVLPGSDKSMPDEKTPVHNKAVDFIIQEALRKDTKLPLYVLCGAGLTDIASALLINPNIADKIILIWIGGPEYSDLAPPANNQTEYNLNIDRAAARVVFNHSSVPLWQVPRNAYRQCLFSWSQLQVKVASQSSVGEYLVQQLQVVMRLLDRHNFNLGETYVLGDSPLVLLTALQSSFDPAPSSSNYVTRSAPLINAKGFYTPNPDGRKIRIYTQLDVNLLFNDFVAKLQLMPPSPR